MTKNPLEKVFDDLAKQIGKKAEMSNVTLEATFAVESEEEDGDDLILTGRLFKAGDYAEQSFSMTPLELHDTISRFVGPAPLDLHHKPNIFGEVDLTGAFGQIDKVWSDDTGEWMMAQARKPKWLNDVMKETHVSATFARSDKSLLGAAWTHDPVVPEAQLVAAFAKHHTPTGQYHLQSIHDATVQGGAVCNKPAAMASRHENVAIQKAHDLTVEHGATCQSIPNGQTMPMFSQPTRRKTMGFRDSLLKSVKKTAAEDGYELSDAEANAELDVLFSKETKVSDLEAKVIALEAEKEAIAKERKETAATFARMEAERRETAAVTFAREQVTAGRISPAAQTPLAALTARILATDATATFAEGEKSNTVLLKEVLDALESDFKIFTKNTVGDDSGPFAALFAETKTKGVGDEEAREDVLKKMRAATPQGRQIDKEKQNGNHA